MSIDRAHDDDDTAASQAQALCGILEKSGGPKQLLLLLVSM
jgi:hypothetical protein